MPPGGAHGVNTCQAIQCAGRELARTGVRTIAAHLSSVGAPRSVVPREYADGEESGTDEHRETARLPWSIAANAANTVFVQFTFFGSVFVLFLSALGLSKGEMGFLLSLLLHGCHRPLHRAGRRALRLQARLPDLLRNAQFRRGAPAVDALGAIQLRAAGRIALCFGGCRSVLPVPLCRHDR